MPVAQINRAERAVGGDEDGGGPEPVLGVARYQWIADLGGLEGEAGVGALKDAAFQNPVVVHHPAELQLLAQQLAGGVAGSRQEAPPLELVVARQGFAADVIADLYREVQGVVAERVDPGEVGIPLGVFIIRT
ncbi:hypothetical protein D3C78_1544370 [compost metagenome]